MSQSRILVLSLSPVTPSGGPWNRVRGWVPVCFFVCLFVCSFVRSFVCFSGLAIYCFSDKTGGPWITSTTVQWSR